MGKPEKEMGNENLDADLDKAFAEAEKDASGIGTIDQSLRATLPDIDGVITQTAKSLISNADTSEDSETLTGPKIIDRDDEDGGSEDQFTGERPTLPPRSNYGVYIEQTTDDTSQQEKERADDHDKQPETEIPDEVDFKALLEEAFGDDESFRAEEYASTAQGKHTISQPPLPDLSEEESILELEDEAAPEIVIDEASLEEQLLFDERYTAVSRILSFFNECDIATSDIIEKVDSFVKKYDKPLSSAEISDILILFFKHLSNSILVKLGKRHKHSCKQTEGYASQLFTDQDIDEKKKDKALVLTLRIIGKTCELYEIKREVAKHLYDEFVEEQFSG